MGEHIMKLLLLLLENELIYAYKSYKSLSMRSHVEYVAAVVYILTTITRV
jgi:hypothetical protein